MTNAHNKGPILILVKDVNENIFGGFFSQDLEYRHEYFGSGESFLFKIKVRV